MNILEKTEQEQLAFFEQCLRRFLAAERATEPIYRYYAIGQITICLRFAGNSLVETLTAALAHLRVDSCAEPDLTICLWESESTGVSMEPPPCERSCFTDRGDIWGMRSVRIKSAFHWIEYSVNLLDVSSKTGIFWVQSSKTLPFWVYASPLRTLLHWAMELQGCQLVHAAAVGTEKGAVLITGKGGVGKSSTALACLEAGFFYIGDDYLVVGYDPEPTVYSLYCTAKVMGDNLTTFPTVCSLLQNQDKIDREKAVLMLYPALQEQLVPSMPLRIIVTPSITGQKVTDFQEIPAWNIQRAMAFTTMSQLPGVGKHTHDFIHALCGRLPVFRIALGNSTKLIPQAIASLLEQPLAKSPQRNNQLEDFSRKPLVSVIIPVYNGESFIVRAIEHVIGQGYPALELIVVDDGSTDATARIVEGLSADVRLFRQDNQGPAAARNRGLRDASGEFVMFLDVDDYWPEHMIDMCAQQMMRHSLLEVIRGYAQLVVEGNGDKQIAFQGNPKESFRDYIGGGMYRKAVFNKVGLFDESLLFGEDSDWFTRARELGVSIQQLDEVTLYVRRHGKNMTEGKSLVELNMLHVIKKALDRKRDVMKTQGEEPCR